MDRVERAKAFLRKVADEGTIETIRARPEPITESMLETLPAQSGLETLDRAYDATRSAAEKVLAGQDLTPPEQFALEAIIIPGQRPAVDIVNDGDFTVDMPLFAGFSSDPALKAKIQKALRSIGRIEVSGFPGLPYGGTGFVVGKDLLMTNRHVAELFSNGLGVRSLSFKPGMGAGIDFRQERGHPQPEVVAVRRVVMIHPFWDMALLQTEGLDGHDPLNLSLEQPDGYSGRLVAVVGYPAFDPRNPADVQNQVFNQVYNVKRLLPGKAGTRRDIASFGHSVSAATHDASTLGGNSGSAVFDPSTGTVLGLHFAGLYLDANFFVPASELSRDDRVVKAGANFGPNVAPDPDQTSKWWAGVESPSFDATSQTSEVSSSGDVATSSGSSMTWTVPLQIKVEIGDISTSR